LKSIAVNVLVIVWITVLLYAPAMAWGLYRRSSVSTIAAGGALTLVMISGVTFIAGLMGFGSLLPLRFVAILLGVVLLWVCIRGTVLLRRRVVASPIIPFDWLALPLGLCLGVWVLVPPLLSLGRQGLTFGLATVFNNDLPNYVLIAQNTADVGFEDSNHLANVNLGVIAHDESYIGATSLINFASAATGLPAWKIAFATMGVAVCLLAVALWALGRTFWPQARYEVAAAVIAACLAGMSAYTYAHFFLGGVLGLASVATSLTGATLLARKPDLHGMAVLSAGGALGVYCYGHLGLPVLLVLPLWVVVAALLCGHRGRRALGKVAARSAAAALCAMLLAAVALPTALALVSAQSQVIAGWSIPGVTGFAALLWPGGIGHPSPLPELVASWILVLGLVAVSLVAAWRSGLRSSVRLAAVFVSAGSAVVLAAMTVYGPERYQTWKMEAFLLPLVIVVTLPALGSLVVGSFRVGRAALAALAGAVALGPFVIWAPTVAQPDPAFVTTSGFVALAESPILSDVSSLNIRLPSYFETMSAGAIITKSAVVFTQNSYYPELTALHTCTLTKLTMLPPDEDNFTVLGDGYVLLNRPSKCETRK
jgi:hypothetical protein